MRPFILLTTILVSFCYGAHATNLNKRDSLDIVYYESLCPGFQNRYNAINDCKYKDIYSTKESIKILNNILLQIEREDGLFDDVNYFEAVRLVCYKHIQYGDYSHVDSTLFAVKKFLYDNFKNPFDFPGLYKYNHAASWLEMNAGRYDSAQQLLKDVISVESDEADYLLALQDLAMCYLQTDQIYDFHKTTKEIVLIADTIQSNMFTKQLMLFAKRLEAHRYLFSENDLNKYKKALEDLLSRVEKDDYLIRFKCDILNDLSEIYLDNDQIKKYIKVKKEILKCKILSDEYKINVLESIMGAEWLVSDDEEIIEHVILHSNLCKEIAINNYRMFPPTKNIWLWPTIMEKINKDSYILNRFPKNTKICELCYDNQLFLKNQYLSSDYAIRQFVYFQGDSLQKQQLSDINSLREFIVYNASEEKYGDTYSSDLAYMETDLIRLLPMRKITEDHNVTWKDVASHLNNDEIAIEITDCCIMFPQDSISSQLIALVVTNNCKSPQCVALGNYYDIAGDLKQLFSGDIFNINQVYSTYNNSIYQLLWNKLNSYLKGKNTVYISTNTLLSFVNLGALLNQDGVMVSEAMSVRMLSTTAEILSIKEHIQYSSATLFGGGCFDADSTCENSLYTDVIRAISDRGDFRELKGVTEEVDIISKELENQNVIIKKYSGKNATEKNFRSLNDNSSQVIHIATHCFVIKDMANYKYLSRLMALDTREAAMLGTGFILANANSSWNRGVGINHKEDGVIISEDISRLNLSGCDLLVLSGCQSGEGKMDNDGAYGLQRAFKRAGVKTMLLSLWNVDDNVTKEFMIEFYKDLLQTNSKYEAYISAQKSIKNKYIDPYYWAAFIMLD